ncbi:hypothetical protein PRIPAC_81573, partial [Pristionchus pacificus]
IHTLPILILPFHSHTQSIQFQLFQMVEQNLLLGGLATVISVVCFGSVFVPIKKFEARDGIFVALMMSVGQLIPCLISSFAYSTPTVFPLALLSGVFYALANSCSIFIMEGVGMAVGGLVWNVVTAITGWAIARFGLFGTPAEIPASNILNIIGVCVLCLGGLIFTFVQSTPISTRPAPHYESQSIDFRTVGIGRPFFHETKKEGTPIATRFIAFGLAILCGFLYGNTPTPINYLKVLNNEGYIGLSSHNGAYMLSFSIGSILTSLVVFTAYSFHRRNLPFINVEIAVPSLLGGILYGTATAFLFVAMEHLNQAIVFPICAIAPGIVNTLWAVLFYKEIYGKFNFSSLAVAYLVTLTGIILIAVSKNTPT